MSKWALGREPPGSPRVRTKLG